MGGNTEIFCTQKKLQWLKLELEGPEISRTKRLGTWYLTDNLPSCVAIVLRILEKRTKITVME